MKEELSIWFIFSRSIENEPEFKTEEEIT